MQSITQSSRLKSIERKWRMSIRQLFYLWHWRENLIHKEIGKRVGLPRSTITRWFHLLGIPSQSCSRFTNLNLLNTGPRNGPRALPKVKREFPWKVDHMFFQKWSEEMAYVLGFIVADGAVFTNPRGSSYLAFYSTDKEIIEKIRSAMGSNHKIGERVKSRGHKNLFVLQIGSKKLIAQLKKFGIIQNKSLVVGMPNTIPEQYLGHFVRGYFDGDGCIYHNKHKSKDRKNQRWVLSTRFASGSRKLLDGLQERLRRYTNGGYIYGKDNDWDLSYTHRDTRRLFHLLYDKMKSNLFLVRKYKIYLEVMNVDR